MQEICNQLSLGVNADEIDVGYDPFSDKLETLGDTYKLIGYAYIYLEVIYHLLVLDEDLIPIIDDKGTRKGSLKMAVTPEIPGLSLAEVDNLKDLAGKKLNLGIMISEAIDIPDTFSTNVFCKYRLDMCSEEEFSTEKCDETTTNPRFRYNKTHNIDITSEIAGQFLNHALAIGVYGDITSEMKQREMNKLKDNVNKAIIKPGVALKPGMSHMNYDEFEEEEKDVYQEVPNDYQRVTTNGATTLKEALEQREKEIQALRAELEKANRGGNNNEVQTVKRGSCACLIF